LWIMGWAGEVGVVSKEAGVGVGVGVGVGMGAGTVWPSASDGAETETVQAADGSQVRPFMRTGCR